MTGHLKVGFELEMSDIKTVDAATIVYGDLVHWKDRYGDHARPTLTYDRFHVVSDGMSAASVARAGGGSTPAA